MKRNLVISAMLLMAATILAIPAKRIKRTLTLSDGTKVEATLRGDERVHYYETEDGRCFQTSLDKAPREVKKSEIQERLRAKIQQANSRRLSRAASRKAKWGEETNPISGKKKGLVILVNFSDKKMVISRDNFIDVFNCENYKQNGFAGSVHDYFYSCSYGQFDLSFDVVGPYTVSQTMQYYGKNDEDENDMYPAKMVAEAIKLADNDVNYKDYDWDGNGEVDQVYVIYAGYAESQGADENTIWPHEFELSSAGHWGDGPGALYLDGVRIDTYACSSELTGIKGSKIDGIGTACHEFSHCMCIPDLYDVEGSNFGMDSWDVMDYGSYNNGGYCPAAYTSYERMYCGWLTPIELTDPTSITEMPALTQEPVAYRITNEGNKNEYYLLENRQYNGFDTYGKGHGMLVLHVDFNSSIWINNEVNTTASRQRLTIIPADNVCSHSSLSGDPFPGTARKTELTDNSTPAATLYSANKDGRKRMGHPITNISETDGLISFDFDGGSLIPAPIAMDVFEVNANGFWASWQPVDDADYYQLEITESKKGLSSVTLPDLLLLDDFSSSSTAETDGSADISSFLDEYTTIPGWTGSKVFTAGGGGLKLGASKITGVLTTPVFIPTGNKITVVCDFRKYGSDTGVVYVTKGTSAVKLATITPSETASRQVFHITASGTIQLTFTTSTKRAYLKYIAIYDGEVSEDDIANGHTVANTKTTTQVDVYDTKYKVTDINIESIYSYKVRTVRGTFRSPWSNEISIDIEDPVLPVYAEEQKKTVPLFDLNGRRVVKPTKGVYIQDGKKMLIQ